jgi:hypothetical protein
MPVKRRAAKSRSPLAVTFDTLWPIELAFLRDEPEPDGGPYGAWWALSAGGDKDRLFRPDRPSIDELWAAVGDAIVEEWIEEAPGTRPSTWWRFTAPRLAAEDWPHPWFGQEAPPEPRRRVGGTGRPAFEWTAYVARWWCGVPCDWIWVGDAMLGARAEAADPDDPPVFESQAVYLQRFGLCLPGELAQLEPTDFEPEAIRPPGRQS